MDPLFTNLVTVRSVLKHPARNTAPGDLAEEIHYELGPFLGQGGFGSVYQATQLGPFDRPFALKILDRNVPERFSTEVQAMAQLNHPYIVKIFEAGKTSDGRGFLAMELIEGLSITNYVHRKRLTLEERLVLFHRVCQAVTHAHRKGVIHRDLKPSNILVRERDGQAEPVLIDFGLAKAAFGHPPIGGKEFRTETGMFFGTPEYISPEQADPSLGDIDTRSDIYSLGTLLYQLLTGETPFPPKKLRTPSPLALERILREVHPKSPSHRLASLPENDQRLVAKCVQSEFAKYQKRISGELDWIVAKAMEKSPQNRYPSSLAFASDIQHFLAHEPVSVGRPSLLRQGIKFTRRHRGLTLALSGLLLSLLAGLTLSTYAFLQANRHEEEARQEAQKTTRVLTFLKQTFHSAAPDIRIGKQITAVELLNRATQNLDSELTHDPEFELELRLTIADVYFDLGQPATAHKHQERARELLKTIEASPKHVEDRILLDFGSGHFYEQ